MRAIGEGAQKLQWDLTITLSGTPQADNASLKAQCRHLRALLANRTVPGSTASHNLNTALPGAPICEPRRGLVIRLPPSSHAATNEQPKPITSPTLMAHHHHKRPAAAVEHLGYARGTPQGGTSLGAQGACATQLRAQYPCKRHLVTCTADVASEV